MKFCIAISCMDGRVQVPVNTFLQKYFDAAFVDTITDAGPVQVLALRSDAKAVQKFHKLINISITKHNSTGIAVIAHHDCAGNPIMDDAQKQQVKDAVEYLKQNYPNHEVIGLWLDEKFSPEKI